MSNLSNHEKIKLGIIGIGNMGSAHAWNVVKGYCPEIELVAVADINPARIEWARDNLPDGVTGFNTAEEMLDSGLIDSCIVAVPHYDHTKYAIECIKRGIHVMVEKPAGVYSLAVKEMNDEAERHPEVVFGMMFNQRTNHIYRKMRELVQSGVYGEIRRTNWIITDWYRPQAYYNSGGWRATWSGEGGGVLMNQCPHQLDLWQWICGMPVKVLAKMKFGKWHDIEVEDDVTAYVEYPNGATGVFVTTTADPCGTNRFEIQLDRAKIIADYNGLSVTEFDMPEQEFSKTNTQPFGNVAKHDLEIETDGKNEQHVGILNAWASAILHGTELIAKGTEGINEITLANAMYMSAFLDKEVEIPFDENLYYDELMKRVASSRRKDNVTETYSDTRYTYGGNK